MPLVRCPNGGTLQLGTDASFPPGRHAQRAFARGAAPMMSCPARWGRMAAAETIALVIASTLTRPASARPAPQLETSDSDDDTELGAETSAPPNRKERHQKVSKALRLGPGPCPQDPKASKKRSSHKGTFSARCWSKKPTDVCRRPFGWLFGVFTGKAHPSSREVQQRSEGSMGCKGHIGG